MNLPLALDHTTYDFLKPTGKNFESRIEDFSRWIEARHRDGVYQYGRRLNEKAGPSASVENVISMLNEKTINFSSQDYLGLSSHSEVIEAGVRAIHEFGIHSAGSPMILGRTHLSERLEKELGNFLNKKYVLLYPTGWAAGFGGVTGIVRRSDHIIMDRLSHASLQIAAQASGAEIHRFEHLSGSALKEMLVNVRHNHPNSGIFVMTEGIFSMDSDRPDLLEISDLCREYEALMFVDVAHDLGAIGPNGLGQIGLQGVGDHVDVIMGSFSKSFAANGGFVATNSEKLYEYSRMFGNSYMFSNALAPVQTAVVSKCLSIIQSSEGEKRRKKVARISTVLRETFAQYGIKCFGEVSPIIPVPIGSEAKSRQVFRDVQSRGVAAAVIEFPIVPRGSARFRLQAMATHSEEQARQAAKIISESIDEISI